MPLRASGVPVLMLGPGCGSKACQRGLYEVEEGKPGETPPVASPSQVVRVPFGIVLFLRNRRRDSLAMPIWAEPPATLVVHCLVLARLFAVREHADDLRHIHSSFAFRVALLVRFGRG